MKFHERLKYLRKKDDYTQDELAKKIGVTAGAIGLYEQGRREPDNLLLQKLASIFGVSVDYLLGFNDFESNILSFAVPILGKVACGEPIFSPEFADVYTTIDSKLNVDFALVATGDSMTDAGISDGDIVLIKQQPTVETGEIAAVSINDEVTLKRVYYYPEANKLVLQPANPNYPPMIYLDAELSNVHILGKAIAVQHIL